MNQNTAIPSTVTPSTVIPKTALQDRPAEAPAAPPAAAGDPGTAAPAAALAVPPVSEGREQMDAVDAQIIELMLHRIEISRRIQAARLAEGGRRIDLRRETQIIGRYTAALGRPGTAVGMAMLELGRGRADRPGGGEPAARA